MIKSKSMLTGISIIVLIIILTALTGCSSSDNKEVMQVKKEIDSLNKQISQLKEENEKMKKQLTNRENINQDINEQNSNNLDRAIKSFSLGQKLSFDDTAEIVIEKYDFTNKVLPSNPGSFYNYYQLKDSDKTFFHVVGKYKHLGTEEVSFLDIPIKFYAKYQDKYIYNGFQVAEVSGGSDLDAFAYAKPLSNLKFHVLIEVPNEVKDNGKLELYIKSSNDEYVLKVKD